MEAIAADLQTSVADLGGRVSALEAGGTLPDSIAVPNVFLINSVTGAVEGAEPTLPQYFTTFGSVTSRLASTTTESNWLQAGVSEAEATQPLLQLWTPTPGEGLVLNAASGRNGPERGRMLLTLAPYFNETINKPLLGPYMAVLHFTLGTAPEALVAGKPENSNVTFGLIALDTAEWPNHADKELPGAAAQNLNFLVRIHRAAAQEAKIRLVMGGYGANASAEAELVKGTANGKALDYWLVVYADVGLEANTVGVYRAQVFNSNPFVFGTNAEPLVTERFSFGTNGPARTSPLNHVRIGLDSLVEAEAAEREAGKAIIRTLRVIPLGPVYPSE